MKNTHFSDAYLFLIAPGCFYFLYALFSLGKEGLLPPLAWIILCTIVVVGLLISVVIAPRYLRDASNMNGKAHLLKAIAMVFFSLSPAIVIFLLFRSLV